MHEMSIAQSILSILKDEMAKNDIEKLGTVRIKNGALAGVVTDALQFAWEALTPGTEFEGCVLVVEEIPLKLRCGKCATEFSPDNVRYTPCPVCEELLGHDVLEGKEMLIESIEPVQE